MSALQRALKHGALYGVFQFLGLGLSLVSFPILTRILSVEEYGHLALFTATTSLLVALSKCGVTTSFIRAYAGAAPAQRAALHSSAFGLAAAMAATVALLFSLLLLALGQRFDALLQSVLQLAGLFLVAAALRDVLYSFLRAQERSLALSLIGLLDKVGGLVLGITGVMLLGLGVRGYLGGMIAFDALVVLALAAWFRRAGLLAPGTVQRHWMRELLAYGAPLLLYEVSWLANEYAGRFLLNAYLGAATVGVFSVGYNLASYVLTLVNAPINMGLFPVYTKVYESEGVQATSAFLGGALRYYVAGAALIVVLMSATRADLIAVLATPRFAQAATVVPWVILSVMLYGATLITGAGYHLQRRTREFGVLMLGCAVLNVAANLVLIPAVGMLGSALATLLSYGTLSAVITLRARRLVPVPWPRRTLVDAGVSSLLALGTAFVLQGALASLHPFARLLLVGTATGLVYVGAILALDGALRAALLRLARRRLRRA